MAKCDLSKSRVQLDYEKGKAIRDMQDQEDRKMFAGTIYYQWIKLAGSYKTDKSGKLMYQTPDGEELSAYKAKRLSSAEQSRLRLIPKELSKWILAYAEILCNGEIGYSVLEDLDAGFVTPLKLGPTVSPPKE